MSWPAIVPDPSDRSTTARRERMRIFAEWLVTPHEFRAAAGMPSSQAQLAEIMGVHAITLSNWKQHPEFQDLLANQVRSNVAATDFGEIINNLVRIAKSDTAQAVPAAREVLRWFRDSRPQGKAEKSLDSLSDDELRQMLNDGS